MAINNLPSNLANLVSPFIPVGQRPVGQETVANRNSVLKPVEQLAKTAGNRIQQKPDEQHQNPSDNQRGSEPDSEEQHREQSAGARAVAAHHKPSLQENPVELYSDRQSPPKGARGCLVDESV